MALWEKRRRFLVVRVAGHRAPAASRALRLFEFAHSRSHHDTLSSMLAGGRAPAGAHRGARPGELVRGRGVPRRSQQQELQASVVQSAQPGREARAVHRRGGQGNPRRACRVRQQVGGHLPRHPRQVRQRLARPAAHARTKIQHARHPFARFHAVLSSRDAEPSFRRSRTPSPEPSRVSSKPPSRICRSRSRENLLLAAFRSRFFANRTNVCFSHHATETALEIERASIGRDARRFRFSYA